MANVSEDSVRRAGGFIVSSAAYHHHVDVGAGRDPFGEEK